MADTVKIYTLDKTTEYQEGSIKGANIALYVEDGSTAKDYVTDPNMGFDGTHSILYSTFNINLNDIAVDCIIGEGAFQNHNEFTTIEIPNSVVEIGQGIFEGCANLTSISLPFVGDNKESEKTFGWIFNNNIPTGLNTVNITGDINTIPDCAFKEVQQLTNISLPKSVTKIGSNAFYNTSIINLTIPDGVTELGKGAFYGMNELKTFSWYTKNYQLNHIDEQYLINTYFDSNFITHLNDKTEKETQMYGYQYIENASTNNDNYYGTEKFDYNDKEYAKYENIPSLIVAKTDTSTVVAFAPILSRFFEEHNISPNPLKDLQGKCGGNLTYTIEPISNVQYKLIINGYGDMWDYSSDQDTPWYSFQNTIVELQLPDRISSIGDYAFTNLSNVTEIILPQTIKRIGKYAFSGCEKAQFSDLLKDSEPNLLRLLYLQTIEENAFEGCKKLKVFDCDGGVLNKIDKYAFKDCSGLTKVVLPDKDIYLEEGMFFNCDNIKELFIPISSDIGKGEKNDFTKFKDNYRKYNIGSLFKTYQEENVDNKITPDNIDKYIKYDCWFTGISYYLQEANTYIQASDGSNGFSKIENLYLPKTLKYITIRNGIMPQFYLYNGSTEDSYWKKVILEKAVEKTIHFTYNATNPTIGFKNTKITCDNSGRLVGVIADNIELYNITLDTFYNADGLLGFYNTKNATNESDFIPRNTLCASKCKILKQSFNQYYRKVYSYSISYQNIVCKGLYQEYFIHYGISPISITKLDLINTSLSTLSNMMFNQSMEIDELDLPNTVNKITTMDVYNTQGVRSTQYLNIKRIEGHEDGVITDIASSAFEGNATLEQFNCKIKSNSIPFRLFAGCTKLTKIKEIEGVNINIGESAFAGCLALQELNFSVNSTVEVVEARAFQDCQNLATQLPCCYEGLKVYGSAFNGCSNLIFMYLNQVNTVKIKELNGTQQFHNCSKLEQVYFSDTITSIPDYCFTDCNLGYNKDNIKKLSGIRVPSTITQIGQQAFQGYKGSWIELPQISTKSYTDNSVTYSGLSYNLGKPNSTLKEVYISNSIEIPQQAFTNWSELDHIYFYFYKSDIEKIVLNSENFDEYFENQSPITWDLIDTSKLCMKLPDNCYRNPISLSFEAIQDNIFSFDVLVKKTTHTDIPSYWADFFVLINNVQMYTTNRIAVSKQGHEQILIKKGDIITFRGETYNSEAICEINMSINDCPEYSDSTFTEKFEPYPQVLPWNESPSGGKMRVLSSPLVLTKNTIQETTEEKYPCMYLDTDKEYLWKLLLYGKQYDVYITDNNTYTEQYSYLPKLYAPNHNGIEVGQHIELQGENTYEIINTQLFNLTGKTYYRQSQGVVNGKISYYGVSNGTLTYNLEQEKFEVDEPLKKVLTSQPIEFSTGSSYEQILYKGKISLIGEEIIVDLDEKTTVKEFEYDTQIALKNTVIRQATLKSELLSSVHKDSKFVVSNSNQIQTITDINEFYEITITPGFNINTTGYNEIQITLADESSRILPNDINNNEIVVVVNTKGNLLINGALDEEVKKGVIDEHLISLIEAEHTSFKLEGVEYTITDVDVLNKTIYFENTKNNKGYIINNQVSYDHEIQLINYRDLITDHGFDTTDLHLTLNYINTFEVDTIKEYKSSNKEFNRKDFKLEDGEELYLISCKEIVKPTNYEVTSRDLEKEAILERYSTILTVETLDGEVPQNLLVYPNTNYYIYSNNIKTPPYYFETREKQDIKVIYKGKEIEDELTMDCGSGLFEATYKDNIASCTWSLQELYEEEYIEIDKVVNQYASNLFYNYHLFKDDTAYKLQITITTEDGLVITKDIYINVAYEPQLDIVQVTVEKDCDKQAIKINLMDIGLKIKDLDYKICPRTWLYDKNAKYQIDSLYVIRENLDEPSEKAVIAQVQGFPKYIYDYSFQREDKYKYSILPIYYHVDYPSDLIRGVPSTIEPEIQFNLKTIALISTEMDLRENIQENDLLVNNYQVDKLPFTKWFFKYNTEARNVNIVTDKTVFETISPFATVNYSARNYKTGTVTAFLGSYHKNDINTDWTYKDSIRLQNKFQEFANNGKIKMLRDEIGNVVPVDITLKSFEYNTHTIPTNITVTFEWTQIDTEKNLTVFEVEYDNELEKMRQNNKLPNYNMKYN